MRALLYVIGLLLVVAGCAVGAMSFYSPGEIILGLNLGLAATLLVGGLIIIAMSSMIGAINDLAELMMPVAAAQLVREAAPVEQQTRTGTFTAVAAGAATAAAGAAAAKAADATETVSEVAADAVAIGGDAVTASGDAIESVKADVRKTLGIEDVKVETSADGSTSVSERTEDTAQEALEPTSVAARIGAITAGVKAAADGAGDKFEEVSETVEQEAESATDTSQETLVATSSMAAEAVEPAAEALDSATQSAEEAIEQAAEVVEEAEAAVTETTDVAEEAEATVADQLTEAAEEISETDAAGEADVSEETVDAEEVSQEVEPEEATEDIAAIAESDAAEEAEAIEPETPAVVEEEVVEEEVVEEEVVEAEQPAPEVAPEAEAVVHEEGALYVVEETTVRERPARMLSDGTVEAETDAGWMRFENLDHLNEYLDAMSA